MSTKKLKRRKLNNEQSEYLFASSEHSSHDDLCICVGNDIPPADGHMTCDDKDEQIKIEAVISCD